jgi:hypothetical protein
MPSRQRGRIEKLPSGRWSVRFYDESGARVRQGGFETKSEAGEWLERKLDEVAAFRRGDGSAVARAEEITFAQLAERYLAAHEADDVTIARLRSQLSTAVATFGERPIRSLRPDELAAWRKTIGNRHHVFRAVKQVLAQAERWEWLEKSPARHIANPKPKAPEIQPFGPRSPRLLTGPLEGVREDQQAAAACSASPACPRRPRHASAAPRLAAPLPGRARRLHRARQVSRAQVDTGPPCRRHPPPPHLRHEAHVCHLEPRCGRLPVRALAPDGDVAPDDRPDLRAPSAHAEEQERTLLDAHDKPLEGGRRRGTMSHNERTQTTRLSDDGNRLIVIERWLDRQVDPPRWRSKNWHRNLKPGEIEYYRQQREYGSVRL